jgi:hypothetical protein
MRLSDGFHYGSGVPGFNDAVRNYRVYRAFGIARVASLHEPAGDNAHGVTLRVSLAEPPGDCRTTIGR